MLRRKRVEQKGRGELFRAELTESADHAMRAAGHAAGGVRARVGPRVAPAAKRVSTAAARGWDTTRAKFAPLSETAQLQVKNGRVKAKRKQPRRWPKLAGLLAGGAAVGAGAAYLLRRRRQQQQWQEYDPAADAVGVAPAPDDALAAPASEAAPAQERVTSSEQVDASAPASDNRRT